jgi:hypothetical protein
MGGVCFGLFRLVSLFRNKTETTLSGGKYVIWNSTLVNPAGCFNVSPFFRILHSQKKEVCVHGATIFLNASETLLEPETPETRETPETCAPGRAPRALSSMEPIENSVEGGRNTPLGTPPRGGLLCFPRVSLCFGLFRFSEAKPKQHCQLESTSFGTVH